MQDPCLKIRDRIIKVKDFETVQRAAIKPKILRLLFRMPRFREIQEIANNVPVMTKKATKFGMRLFNGTYQLQMTIKILCILEYYAPVKVNSPNLPQPGKSADISQTKTNVWH